MKQHKTKSFFLISLNSISLLMGFELSGFQFVIYKIAKEFSLTNAEMGTLISVMVATLTISGAILGPISDKYGKKKTILLTLFAIIIASGICIISSNLVFLVCGIIVMGIGIGGVENATIAAISDLELHKAGKHVSIMQSIVSFGGFASPILIGFFIRSLNMDWRSMYFICGAFALISISLISITKFNESNNIKNTNPLIPPNETNCKKQTFEKISDKRILIGLLICVGIYIFVENGITYFVDLFMSTELNAPGYSSLALSFFWIGMATSRMISGKLYQHENLIITISLIVLATLLCTLAITRITTITVIVYLLLGVFCGPVWPFYVGKINKKFPNRTGFATALILVIGGACGTISPIIMGYVADAFNISIGIIALSVTSLCCLIVFSLVSKKSCGKELK